MTTASAPRLAHVVLQTARPDEMAQFYTKVMNGHSVFAGNGLAFLTCDEEHHRIALAPLPGEAQSRGPNTPGMHHVAFTFETLDDLLDHYLRLAAEGIRPAVPVQHGMTTSLYYRDPDGNFVELQIDNFATADEATAYMRGPEFAADSFGPSFDVEKMVEARASGTGVAELTSRAWALAGPELPHPITVLAGLDPENDTTATSGGC